MDATRTRPGNVLRAMLKGALWLVVVLCAAEFLLSVHGKYHALHGPAYARFVDRHGWLWLHLAGGAITLVVGALQLIARWWCGRPSLHRWVGYVYFGGMLTASAAAAALITTTPAPLPIRIGFAGTALAWLATALLALRAIHAGRVQAHRAWMIRNYAVTFAPVLFRLMLPAAIASGLQPDAALISELLWASWLVPLVVVEGILRLTSTSAARPYRWRTALRRHLPWFLIDRGVARKGRDCEALGGVHSWYNRDGLSSGCYHCTVVREGRHWDQG